MSVSSFIHSEKNATLCLSDQQAEMIIANIFTINHSITGFLYIPSLLHYFETTTSAPKFVMPVHSGKKHISTDVINSV